MPPLPYGRGSIGVASRLNSPVLIEEAGEHDLAREAAVRRRGGVYDGVVRQLGRLPGVGRVGVFTEGEATVEHDVAIRVERIWKNQNRRVGSDGVAVRAHHDAFGGPLYRQAIGDARENAVA